MCLSLEEVTVRAGHKVLMEIDYSLLIVFDPQWILDQQLRVNPISFLNIITILFIYIRVFNYFKKLRTKGRN
jgi:hypothetical protein